MLKVRNINKTYKGKIDYRALHNVSFELPDKGLFAILGPSGCGKTTLLNIIGGMDSDFEGSFIINNRLINTNNRSNLNDYRKDDVGFIFQHAVLLNSLTVYENIIFPLQIDAQPNYIIEKRATEILKLLNINDLRNRKVNTLSGGQKQRVVIARALMNDPKIILADEPTGELDSKNSKIILDILQKLASERLIIMVTHEEKFAYDYAEKIIKMKDGQIVEIIDNSNNVKKSNLNFNLTKKKESKKKAKLPFFTNLKIALRSLGLHKGRNILSSIGLSIGLTGIALAISLTNGFQRFVTDALGGFENENYIKLVKSNKDGFKPLTDVDYDFIINNSDVNLVKYDNYYPSGSTSEFNTPLVTSKDNVINSFMNVLLYKYVPYDSNNIYI
ncbi:TPA: ATP-binding cassette domain-containing protein [bacterium]|jgi:ABC-type lipoprotein export system ATPase subunit|nr:ATP-binding cassette domain-containing protein [bacterium]